MPMIGVSDLFCECVRTGCLSGKKTANFKGQCTYGLCIKSKAALVVSALKGYATWRLKALLWSGCGAGAGGQLEARDLCNT